MGVWRLLALMVLFGSAAIFVRCWCLVFLLTGIDHCGLGPACGIWRRLFDLSWVLPLFNVLCVYGVCLFFRLFLWFRLFGLSGQLTAHRLQILFLQTELCEV